MWEQQERLEILRLMFLYLSRDIANELVDTTAGPTKKTRQKKKQTNWKGTKQKSGERDRGWKKGIVLSLPRAESDKWVWGGLTFLPKIKKKKKKIGWECAWAHSVECPQYTLYSDPL